VTQSAFRTARTSILLMGVYSLAIATISSTKKMSRLQLIKRHLKWIALNPSLPRINQVGKTCLLRKSRKHLSLLKSSRLPHQPQKTTSKTLPRLLTLIRQLQSPMLRNWASQMKKPSARRLAIKSANPRPMTRNRTASIFASNSASPPSKL
jgi:hypothetical protein